MVEGDWEPVVVKAHETLALRLPVEEFFYPKHSAKNHDGKKSRDLFLRAFLRMTQWDPADPYSFYQICGIHGLPYEDYDKVKSSQTQGYCTHGSPLFPVWHRVYVQLFEQGLIKAAEEVVSAAFEAGSDQLKEGLRLARLLRMPYWDWASLRNVELGLPSIFLEPTVKVTYPSTEEQTLPNPLQSYVVQRRTTRKGDEYGAQNLPTAREFVPSETATPPMFELYPTIRYPNAMYESNSELLRLSLMQATTTMFRPGVFSMLKVPDWATFSSHQSGKGTEAARLSKNYGVFTSLEVVHDKVGGVGGHMKHPDTAGFDPIFFFHHCNVDRLAAIWQFCYPDAWAEFNGPEKLTPLTPFRRDGSTREKEVFWSAGDAQDLRASFNADYPELAQARDNGLTPDEFRAAMLCYYTPLGFDEVRWYLNLHKIPKNKYPGPYTVLAYINLPAEQARTAGRAHPNFVGEVPVFSRGRDSQCGRCKAQQAAGTDRIDSSLDVTSALDRLRISLIDNTEEDKNGTHRPAYNRPVVRLVDHKTKDKLPFPLTLIAQPRMTGEAEVLDDSGMRYGLTGVYHVRDALEERVPETSGKAVSMAMDVGGEGEGGGRLRPVHVARVFSLNKTRHVGEAQRGVEEGMQVADENDPGNRAPSIDQGVQAGDEKARGVKRALEGSASSQAAGGRRQRGTAGKTGGRA